MTTSNLEYALLALDAYSDTPPYPAGWAVQDDPDGFSATDSNFAATTYVKDNEIVIAFRGICTHDCARAARFPFQYTLKN